MRGGGSHFELRAKQGLEENKTHLTKTIIPYRKHERKRSLYITPRRRTCWYREIEDGSSLFQLTLLTTVALHSLLVHSLAHELAASPEATSRLLSSAERCLARSDEGGELGKADDGNEGEAVVEALPLALQKWL